MLKTSTIILAEALDKALEQNYHMQRHLRKLKGTPAGTVKLNLRAFKFDAPNVGDSGIRETHQRQEDTIKAQAEKIRELQTWKDHQLLVWEPVQEYMQKYPDMKLGQSMAVRIIEFLDERLRWKKDTISQQK